jgi:ethanolamine ammonia-lyase small subunit
VIRHVRSDAGDAVHAFAIMRRSTPARLGVGRAGPRYTTAALLRFRADHARAVDAVMTAVSPAWVRRNGLIELRSRARTREEYLLRPELGRRLAPDDARRLARLAAQTRKLRRGSIERPSVLICVGDGLSSAAIERNAAPLCRGLARLLGHDCRLLPPVFVRNARVRIEDHLGELLRPDVVVMLIGERPGLATAESLSAYVIWRPTLKSLEPDRTVISNIHAGGIRIADAARKIAALVGDAIRHRATGAALAQKTAAGA